MPSSDLENRIFFAISVRDRPAASRSSRSREPGTVVGGVDILWTLPGYISLAVLAMLPTCRTAKEKSRPQ